MSYLGIRTANLLLSKANEPLIFEVGHQGNYIVTITNNGPSPATGVVITDIVPSSFTIAGVAYAFPSTITYDIPANTITITLDQPLLVNESTLYQIVVFPNSSGIYQNTATVIGNEFGTNKTSNTVTTTVIDSGYGINPSGGQTTIEVIPQLKESSFWSPILSSD